MEAHTPEADTLNMREQFLQRPRQRGMAFLYSVIAMTALLGFASLGIDFGRAQAAKAELQRAVDAAARYGARGLNDGTTVAKAIAAAADNTIDADNKQPLVLTASNIQTGNWNNANNTFTPNASPINAVRVSASRTVPLLLSSALGKSQCSVVATSIVRYIDAQPGYGFVGINSVTLTGNLTIDSYLSTAGPYSIANRRTNGNVASNGNVGFTGNFSVYGNVYHGGLYNMVGNGGVIAPGQSISVPTPRTYPAPTLPPTYTNGGSVNGVGNGTISLTAGDYYYTSFSVTGNYTLNVNGPVTLWVNGPINLTGNIRTLANQPGNLKVKGLSSSAVTLVGNQNLYAEVYAPLSAVNLTGNARYMGSIVGRTLTNTGNVHLHYDESLGGGTPANISMVK